MPPKKGIARVVKSKDKPRKSVTTTQAAAARDASKADGDLQVLWLCLKNNGGGQIDHQAVADALGITKNAAKQRYYKIRNHVEGSHYTGKGAQYEEMKAEDQPEEEQQQPDYKSEGYEEDQETMQEEPEEDTEAT